MHPETTSETQRQVKELLLRVLEKPEEARLAFLRDRPGVSEAVKAEVIDLLGAYATPSGSTINKLLAGPMGESSALPNRIGPYQIIKILARGGSSTVYLAHGKADVASVPVAVKTLAYGGDGVKATERFRREIKALARLEHPNIVRLLDGGTTAEGLSYLATEYVEGVHLDVFLRTQGSSLSLADKLQLFLRLCEGVAYANLNLIVHRDLKPSNILVTKSGQPKILDFGIAKLFGESEDVAATTRSMTLRYSSPEQVQGSNISIASDVYSLGVLLYELLLEKSPYRSDERDLEGLTRDIVRNDPTPPRALRRDLPRDLEAIMLKALSKKETDRYRSVDALVAELNRFLAGEPVEAHAGGAAYRASKWMRRYRLALAIGCAFVAVITGGALVSYRYAKNADEMLKQTVFLSAELAHQMLEFNNGRDRASLRATVARTKDRVIQILNSAREDEELTRHLLDALLEIGDLQGHPDSQNLGDPEAAESTYKLAIDLGEKVVRKHPRGTSNVAHLARAYCSLGTVRSQAGKPDEALRYYEKAAQLTEPADPSYPLPTLRAAAHLSAQMYVAEVLLQLGKIEECVNMRREIVAERRRLAKNNSSEAGHEQTLPGDIQTLAGTLRQAKRFDEALKMFQEVEVLAAEQVRLNPSRESFRRLLAQNRGQMGLVYMDLQNYQQAEVEFAAAGARYREIEKLHPAGIAHMRGFNRSTSLLALAQKKAGKVALGAATARTAITRTEALVKAHPDNLELVEELRVIRERAAAQ